MGRGISAKLRGMNSIWGRLESLGGTFLEALHWVLLSPVPGVLEAGQNGHCLLAIEASCGKLLSKIPVIICDSKSDFCLIIAHHVAIFCDLPLEA
jgi:hypothetical protein